jgi:hypothetical protein
MFQKSCSVREQGSVSRPASTARSVAESGAKLVAVNLRTGRAESLGVNLAAVDQVAIRP